MKALLSFQGGPYDGGLMALPVRRASDGCVMPLLLYGLSGGQAGEVLGAYVFESEVGDRVEMLWLPCI